MALYLIGYDSLNKKTFGDYEELIAGGTPFCDFARELMIPLGRVNAE